MSAGCVMFNQTDRQGITMDFLSVNRCLVNFYAILKLLGAFCHLYGQGSPFCIFSGGDTDG